MATIMIAEVPGMTAALYDGMVNSGLGDAMRKAPGFISHSAGDIDGTWTVVEMWESNTDAADWFAKSVQPNLPEGIKPNRRVRELHNIIRA